MSGRQLKERVWNLGLTPVQFAAKVNISMPTVYKLFNGKPVAETTLFKVKRALESLEGSPKNRDSAKKPNNRNKC